jgi:uncharacterized protein (UPF0332 family)
VTPEAERYLAKARLTLERARLMLTVRLTEDAGRSAYLAGYHAAEAFIFERTGKIIKTHKGAHTEFARLSLNTPRIDLELRRFLPQAYDLKAICDYELGPDAVVPVDKAEAAVQMATRFVDCIASLIADGAPDGAC